MSKENSFEKKQLTSEEKIEGASDICLEEIMEKLNDFKNFYESNFIKDTKNEKFGFNDETKNEMLEMERRLREKILDTYEKKENLRINGFTNFKHLLGNSILMLAKNRASRYEQGKTIPENVKEDLKDKMKRLNYYLREATENQKILEEELTRDYGHLDKFTKYFTGKLDPTSPKRILIFNFFRDLETTGIKKEDFSNRLEEIDEETRIKKFLDVQKLEQEGLLTVKEDGDEIYKYV